MTLKARVIPFRDVKDWPRARSGEAARTCRTEKAAVPC